MDTGLEGINHTDDRICNQAAAAHRGILLATLILFATLLVYIPATRGGFFWDDHGPLLRNELIHSPDGLRRFWLTAESQDYFPLTYTLFWVEWRLWGEAAVGYHVVNALLHAAAAMMVWQVLRRLDVPGAWLAGILFAVHPIAAASAAWIFEGKNTLSLALGLLSIMAWMSADERMQNAERAARNAEPKEDPGSQDQLRAERDRSGEARSVFRSAFCTLRSAFSARSYLLSLALFLLALLAKTSVVMLPAVLLLCAWWRRGRIRWKDLLVSLPFFALSLGLGLVTVRFQKHNVIAAMQVRPEGIGSRLAAAGWAAWFYLFKLLLPLDLCVIYPRWEVDGRSFLAFAPLALLVAGVAWLWLRRRTWGRAPLFALAYFVLMLVPVLGFVDMAFMRLSLVADHFQYAAMIGVVAFAAALLIRAAREAGWRGSAGRLGSAACVALLACLTWRRAGLYGAEERMWKENLAKNPSPQAARVAWHQLGDMYVRAGRYDEALDSFYRCIEFEPESADEYYDRGAVFYALGRYDDAIRDYDRVIQLNPNSAAAYNNRGNAYAAGNRLQEALRDYEKAMALDPRSALPYFNRANARLQFGRAAEAIQDFSTAIALKPAYPEAYNNRAAAYFGVHEYGKARADIEMCERLGGRPDPALVQALTAASGGNFPDQRN
jgi:tetratricopeptide (TPR) repeat protein